MTLQYSRNVKWTYRVPWIAQLWNFENGQPIATNVWNSLIGIDEVLALHIWNLVVCADGTTGVDSFPS